MATNLSEFYKGQGKALPSVEERASTATKAGITGYTGSAEQNATLLGYLKSTPNQSGNNVITGDNLAPEKVIQPKPTTTDTSAVGMGSSISSLVESTKGNIRSDQATYEKQTADLAEAMRVSGDTSAYDEQVRKDQGVDVAKANRNKFLTDIEAEQKASIDQINELRKNWGGTTAGLNAEISRVQRESANKLANLGIGLSASSRDYETASGIAERLITNNTNKLKADIESKQFVLQQLGTKLATERSQGFQLELRALDREDSYMKDAIKTATDMATSMAIDGETAFKAIQDLTSGKISISDFYSNLGLSGDTKLGNIDGFDFTSYATDPKHELKVQSLYDSMPNVVTTEEAQEVIDGFAPNSPVTGDMVLEASEKYGVNPKLMLAIMQQDSGMGTKGLAVSTKNPGNVGNDDDGNKQTFKTWNDGVDAVAKWLDKHRSTGVYKDEFLSTINNVVNSTSDTIQNKNSNLRAMKNDVSSGDYKNLYKKIENTVLKALPAEQKSDFINAQSIVSATTDLEEKLKAYSDAGGDTGLLKGTYEKINNKLGSVADPAFKALATDLRIALQDYRQKMSGAAFSDQESADYESVIPSGSNKLDLNLAILEGLRSNFSRRVDNYVDDKAGDGAKFIRDYARNGTTPEVLSQKPQTITTPTGNSFTFTR